MQRATPHAKLQRLRDIIAGYESALVTFSGGVDSTFLLHVASEVLGDNCHALTCVSVTMAKSESDDARLLGQELGLSDRHHVVDSNELEQPGFAANPTTRCALCKTELMDIAGPLAQRLGLSAVLLGTNIDDLGDYRPGISAASSRGAHAPMVDAQLSKDDIRVLSRELGLRTWNKPQLACLSSRFPYGTTITPERLRRVDAFEDGLRKLGFVQVRVRYHDTIARIEVERSELVRLATSAKDIVALGESLGFTYVTMDLAGFRSGSLNEPLVTLRKGSDK
jgi:uncharacterized protein